MSGPSNGVRFEKRDINERSIFWSGVWILVVMIVVAALVGPLYSFLAHREKASQAPPAYLAEVEADALEPPGPRLQVTPELDIEAFRTQEDALLTSYAWVDKESGVVRIPIDEAMRLVAERGLPAFGMEEDLADGLAEAEP